MLAATPPDHQLTVRFPATMGCRPHEAFHLRARDVRDGQVTLHSEKRSGASKNNMRTLPMPQILAGRMADAVSTLDNDDLVLDVSDLRNWRRRVFDPVAERAKLTLTPYDLRHTCASRPI